MYAIALFLSPSLPVCVCPPVCVCLSQVGVLQKRLNVAYVGRKQRRNLFTTKHKLAQIGVIRKDQNDLHLQDLQCTGTIVL